MSEKKKDEKLVDEIFNEPKGFIIKDKKLLENLRNYRKQKEVASKVHNDYFIKKQMVGKDIEICNLQNQIINLKLQAQKKTIDENQEKINGIIEEIEKKYGINKMNVTLDDETGEIHVLSNMMEVCDEKGNIKEELKEKDKK